MKRLLCLILVILFFPLVVADGLLVNYEPVVNEVLPGESVSFNLVLRNTDNEIKNVDVRSVDLNWDLTEDRTKLSVAPNSVIEFEVNYEPLKVYGSGRYGVNLLIISDNERIEQFLPVTVLDFSEVLDVAFISSPSIDPRKETIVKLSLNNRADVVLEDLDVELSGSMFSSAAKVSLLPKEVKTQDFVLNLDETLQEGGHIFNVRIYKGNDVYVNKDFSVNIQKYSDFKEVSTIEESFLYKKEVVEQANEGNVYEKDLYSKRLSLFERWFTSFDPEPSTVKKKDGTYYIEWEVDLGPGESRHINIITNYRLPSVILVVVVLIGLSVWFFKKRSVTVKKKVVTLKKNGKISVHVTVNVKASTNIKDVKIMERIPHILGVLKDTTGLKPLRMNKQEDVLFVYWHVKKMLKGDELILNYTVDVNKGGLLSSCVVRYSEKGNRFIAMSNRCVV